MTTTLYDLSVPTYLQTVSAVAGFLGRAARHCAETGADPDDFVEARLIDDMAPFHFQIGPRRLAFTAETFFLSFSLPNFHFHAATAYAILRTRADYTG